MKKIFLLFTVIALMAGPLRAQLVVVADTNTTQLVNNFVLSGVTTSNITFTGAPAAIGSFSNGSTTNLGLDDGIILSTGSVNGTFSLGSPVNNFASTVNCTPGDSLINTLIPGYTTYDASILEFDLVPAGNVLEFQYVFASEEYPEFVGYTFNDVFGFFISGVNPSGGNYTNANIALIPGTSMPVAINNLNSGSYSAYYVDNYALNGQTIVFDGFTTVLLAQLYVVPSTTYHLKIGISDAGDGAYDSGIFLKAQSMKSYIVTGLEEPKQTVSGIYPNPVKANSVMNITTEQAGKILITISDQTGRLLKNGTIDCGQAGNYAYPIGNMLNDLPSGIYLIGIQTPDGTSVQKAIK